MRSWSATARLPGVAAMAADPTASTACCASSAQRCAPPPLFTTPSSCALAWQEGLHAGRAALCMPANTMLLWAWQRKVLLFWL